MPMMRQYPPRITALTPYSVSPRLNDHKRGPKPTKNSVTFMPERFAAKKCADSCSMMISGSVRITPTIATCVGNTSA